MRKIIYTIFIISAFAGSSFSQFSGDWKLKDNKDRMEILSNQIAKENMSTNPVQIKTRKAMHMYFGAGYSFVIFTNGVMNTGYPLLDTRSGDFLSEVNLYFGIAIASALTLELEPSLLFTRNTRTDRLDLTNPVSFQGTNYNFDFPNYHGLTDIPIVLNARFFPFFTQKSFIRLFFIGAGAGVVYIHENYDHNFTNDSVAYATQYPVYVPDQSTAQWAPIFRIMTGFTGTGGAFGYGGEVRFNIVPLKNNGDPFRTRIAKNFNSVDIALRFYFSL